MSVVAVPVMLIIGYRAEVGLLIIIFFLTFAVGVRDIATLRGFTFTILIFAGLTAAMFYPQYFTELGGIFNIALDDEVIQTNPAHALGKIFGKKKLESIVKIDPLTSEDLSLLLHTFQEHFPKHYLLALTLSRTGMRVGEALGMQWGDIDFNSRFTTVQRGYSHGRIETPKNGKTRRVDMSMQLTETLWMLKREREREMGEEMPEWVFINNVGKLLDEQNWYKRVFKKALDKAELRSIRVHDLRHTYATLLLQAGVPMMYVKEQLGHYSIKVTVDTYGHWIPKGNNDAVDKLDDNNDITYLSEHVFQKKLINPVVK